MQKGILSIFIFVHVLSVHAALKNDLDKERLTTTKEEIRLASKISSHYRNLRKYRVSQKNTKSILHLISKTKTFNDFEAYFKNISTKNLNPSDCLKFNSNTNNLVLNSIHKKAFKYCFSVSFKKDSPKNISQKDHSDLINYLLKRKLNRQAETYLKYLASHQPEMLQKISGHIISLNIIPNSRLLSIIPIDQKFTQYLQSKKAFDYGDRYFNRELSKIMNSFKSAYFMGDEEEAQEILNEGLDFYKNNRAFINKDKAWTLFLTSGKKFLRNNSHEVAIDFFKLSEKIANDEDKLESQFQTIFTFVQNNDYSGAINFIKDKKLSEQFPSLNSKLRFWIAYVFDNSKEWTTAKKLYQDVIKLNPLSFYSILSLKKLSSITPGIDINLLFSKPSVMDTSNFFNTKAKLFRQFQAWVDIKNSNFTEISLSQIERDLFQSHKDELYRHNAIKYLLSKLVEKKMFLSTFKTTYKHLIRKNILFDKDVLSFLFPFEFYERIAFHNKHIDPIVPLSLIRQESAFNPSAYSRAGARGLMQLLPSTARGMRRRLKSRSLYQPNLNIYLGSRYLNGLIEKNEGNLIYALASYNAGQGNVKKWRSSFLTQSNPLYTIESIPFKETRKYVKLIYRNMFFYQLLQDNKEFFKKPLEESLVLNNFKR